MGRLVPVRARLPRPSVPRLHALPGRAADDGRQAGVPLAPGPRARPPRARPARRRAALPRLQGGDGHAGVVRRALRRRRRQGRAPRPPRRPEGGLHGPPSHLRPDVHAQTGRARPVRARRPRRVCLEVRQRRPAPPAPQGGRGAVRQEAGRLVGDALQAQPDEGRAHERPRALAALDLGQRELDARDAVVREDPRRLREPPPGARRVVPHGRLDSPPVGRRRRTGSSSIRPS